ncbi:hypothetical protein IU470_25770 [Nocardia abscessus]|uniref:Uncharacterized protein n=1 Tax=Nocardia abscessus TaxID=120957 RepID=A0ABS0CDS2_9NOCA|nr:hypothetical protein [Nocardia abscessus]MBF6228502.1 hypothetical protein [Nocardia abscessus]
MPGVVREFLEKDAGTLVQVSFDSVGDVLSRPGEVNGAVLAPPADMNFDDLSDIVVACAEAESQIGVIATWMGDSTTHAQLSKLVDDGRRPVRPNKPALVSSQFGFPQFPMQSTEKVEVLEFGSAALLEAVSDDRDIVAILSHANGMNAPLGGTVLCSTLDQDYRSDSPGFLPCADGGPCARGVRTEQSHVPPVRSRPDIFHAEVLLWQVCLGTMAADGMFSPDVSLGQRLLSSARLRNLLTTYEPFVSDDRVLLHGLGLLMAGESLGRTALELNRLSLREFGSAPWVLYGLPERRPHRNAEPDSPRASYEFEVPAGEIRSFSVDLNGKDLRYFRFDTDECVGTVHAKSGVVTLFNHGAEPYRGDIEFYRSPDLPPQVREVVDYWQSAPDLGFTRMMLDTLVKHVAASSPELLDEPLALYQAVVNEIARITEMIENAGVDRALLLPGSLSRLAGIAASETARWQALSKSIADVFYNAMAAGPRRMIRVDVGGVETQEHFRSRDDRCPYCGSVLNSARRTFWLSATTRIERTCHRCGTIYDIGHPVTGLYITGPGNVTRGSSVNYTTDITVAKENQRTLFFAGTVHLEWQPWDTGVGTEVGYLTAEPHSPAASLVNGRLHIPEYLPRGRHNLRAIVVVNGCPWFATRPINVI